MKRFISLLLCICMLVTLLPTTIVIGTATDTGVTITYSPWGPGDVLYQKANVEVTNFTTLDSTLGFWRYVGSANNKDK